MSYKWLCVSRKRVKSINIFRGKNECLAIKKNLNAMKIS